MKINKMSKHRDTTGSRTKRRFWQMIKSFASKISLFWFLCYVMCKPDFVFLCSTCHEVLPNVAWRLCDWTTPIVIFCLSDL
jgi:hypothetical protein